MSAKIPDPAQCEDLLRSLDAQDSLLSHSAQVAAAAGRLAELCGADQPYCLAAAWLHDVGKAPGATAALIAGGRLTPAAAAAADHGRLGAELLRQYGGGYAALAPAVEAHIVGALLGFGRSPETVEEKIVFLADKLVAMRWLGLAGRLADLESRYGWLLDIRLCRPGTKAILGELAAAAALSPWDLERLTAPAPAHG